MDSKRTTGSSSEASFDTFLRDFLRALYERRAAIDSCIRSLQVLPRRTTSKHRVEVRNARSEKSEQNPQRDPDKQSGGAGSGLRSEVN